MAKLDRVFFSPPIMFFFPRCISCSLLTWPRKVNASPSLSTENATDHALKTQLISDVLDVVDLEERLGGKEQRWGLHSFAFLSCFTACARMLCGIVELARVWCLCCLTDSLHKCMRRDLSQMPSTRVETLLEPKKYCQVSDSVSWSKLCVLSTVYARASYQLSSFDTSPLTPPAPSLVPGCLQSWGFSFDLGQRSDRHASRRGLLYLPRYRAGLSSDS